MIRRVVYLLEQPYTDWNHSRFGIPTLRNYGFEVEVFDAGFIQYGVRPDAGETMARYPFVRVFTDRQALVDAVTALGPETFVINELMFGPGAPGMFVYEALSRSGADYSVDWRSFLPTTTAAMTRVGRLVSRARFIARSPRAAARAALAKARFAHDRRKALKAPRLLLAGGTESAVTAPYPTGPRTEIFWTHSWDYEMSLGVDGLTDVAAEPIAVFLDEFRPFHPDYANQPVIKAPEPDAYFAAMRRLFDELERRLGLSVVIAAHPRSDYEQRPDYYGGRRVVRGETARLVAAARLVIAHASLSTNFAVLYGRPILFVTTSGIDPRESLDFQLELARILGRKVAVADEPATIDWDDVLRVDRARYESYVDRFIKKAGSSPLPTWEALAQRLVAMNGETAHNVQGENL